MGVEVIVYEKDGEIIIPQSRVKDLQAMGIALSLDMYGFIKRNGIAEDLWVLPTDKKLDNDLKALVRVVPVRNKPVFPQDYNVKCTEAQL